MKNKRMKIVLRGPAYSDGDGSVYVVEYDSEYGIDFNSKPYTDSLAIKQYGDNDVRIDAKHLPELIADLQEVLTAILA